MKVRLVVTGRSYHTASGIPSELELPEQSTVAEALQALRSGCDDTAGLADSCLIAVSGVHLGTLGHFHDRPLRDGDELTVIAPVAGG